MKPTFKNINKFLIPNDLYSTRSLRLPNVTSNVFQQGSLSFDNTSTNVLVSNGSEWVPINGSSIGSVFVFRPGYTGNYPGIYNNWQTLYDLIVNIPSVRYIIFDDTDSPTLPISDPGYLTSGITIPPGNWNMTGIVICNPLARVESVPAIQFMRVNIGSGTTLNGLYSIDGPMIINYSGTDGPCMTATNPDLTNQIAFTLLNGAKIQCSGTQPFYYLASTLPLNNSGEIIVYSFAAIALANAITPGGETFVSPIKTDGSIFIIALLGGSQLDDNCIISSASTLVVIDRKDANAKISIPIAQPQLTGTLFYLDETNCPIIHSFNVDPTAASDQLAGFKVGDNWINTSTKKFFVCVDGTPAAAIWNGPY
jgi:hypothetical protein